MCFKGPDYLCVGDLCAQYFVWCWESSWNGWCVRLLLYMLDCLMLKEFSKNAFQELCKQDGAQVIGFLNILPRTRSCVCFSCKVYLQVVTCCGVLFFWGFFFWRGREGWGPSLSSWAKIKKIEVELQRGPHLQETTRPPPPYLGKVAKNFYFCQQRNYDDTFCFGSITQTHAV